MWDSANYNSTEESNNKIWQRYDVQRNGLSDEQIAFLTNCMHENLNHARHVENERLTFNSIYMALAGGALTFIFSLDNLYLSAGLTVILLVLGWIAMRLTKRWNDTFDAHSALAKDIYAMLHCHAFPPETSEERAGGTSDPKELFTEEWMYAFSPKVKGNMLTGLRSSLTKRLFFCFYLLIQIILIAALVYFVMSIVS